ncbi:MAG TPA: HAD family hydrolase [Chloroflexota bacterium]|nr:HAD family hydrolase [Chloroflexota bacterium]
MSSAVFLDRDGVINENRADYILHPDEVEFVPRVLRGLALLAAAHLPCYVVTNQAAVGRGLLSEAGLAAIHERIAAEAQKAGARLAGFYHCPHRADERCRCRKPRIGLFEQAAAEHGITLERSYYIGDALTDIQAGQAAGCTTILVSTGRGRSQILDEEARRLRGFYVARNLEQAAAWIIGREQALQAQRRRPGHARRWWSTRTPRLEFV